MTRHSCIICLYSHFNRYYNLCDRCNNFIICYHCYKKKQTHQMKQTANDIIWAGPKQVWWKQQNTTPWNALKRTLLERKILLRRPSMLMLIV